MQLYGVYPRLILKLGIGFQCSQYATIPKFEAGVPLAISNCWCGQLELRFMQCSELQPCRRKVMSSNPGPLNFVWGWKVLNVPVCVLCRLFGDLHN